VGPYRTLQTRRLPGPLFKDSQIRTRRLQARGTGSGRKFSVVKEEIGWEERGEGRQGLVGGRSHDVKEIGW
jgi:hypothetical protein